MMNKAKMIAIIATTINALVGSALVLTPAETTIDTADNSGYELSFDVTLVPTDNAYAFLQEDADNKIIEQLYKDNDGNIVTAVRGIEKELEISNEIKAPAEEKVPGVVAEDTTVAEVPVADVPTVETEVIASDITEEAETANIPITATVTETEPFVMVIPADTDTDITFDIVDNGSSYVYDTIEEYLLEEEIEISTPVSPVEDEDNDDDDDDNNDDIYAHDNNGYYYGSNLDRALKWEKPFDSADYDEMQREIGIIPSSIVDKLIDGGLTITINTDENIGMPDTGGYCTATCNKGEQVGADPVNYDFTFKRDFEGEIHVLDEPYRIKHAIIHEMGHAVATYSSIFTIDSKGFPCPTPADETEEWIDLYNSEARTSGVCEYACSNPAEYFADSFKLYVIGSDRFRNNAPGTYDYVDRIVTDMMGTDGDKFTVHCTPEMYFYPPSHHLFYNYIPVDAENVDEDTEVMDNKADMDLAEETVDSENAEENTAEENTIEETIAEENDETDTTEDPADTIENTIENSYYVDDVNEFLDMQDAEDAA